MVAVNPKILSWARETAALSLEEAARKLGFRDSKRRTAAEKLAHLECGLEHPTSSQLARMSKAYYQPPLVFYLSEPPKRGDRGEDFRPQHKKADDRKGEAHLDLLMRDIKVSQSLVRNLLEESNADRLEFVNSSTMSMGVEAVALDIIETLDFQVLEYRAEKGVRSAFAYLRQQVESQGVFVLLQSDLGSHHTTIPVDVFRSFSFADDLAPFIVINRQDDVASWSFTVLYEVAHLWLGKSGVSSAWSENDVQQFCHQVAGTILVRPYDRARVASRLKGGHHCAIDEVKNAACRLYTSPAVLSYLLMLDRRISPSCWESLQGQFEQDRLPGTETQPAGRRPQNVGVNYYKARRHLLGSRLIDLTKHYVRTGQLSPTKAGVVLGVAPTRVHSLLFPERA